MRPQTNQKLISVSNIASLFDHPEIYIPSHSNFKRMFSPDLGVQKALISLQDLA